MSASPVAASGFPQTVGPISLDHTDPPQPLAFTPRRSLERLEALTNILDIRDKELAQFRLFFNAIPDLACIVNEDGIIRYANPAWLHVLGWENTAVQGRSIFRFLHPDDLDSTRQIMTEMTGKPVVGFINRYCTPHGSYVTLQWSAASWRNGLTYATARPIPSGCTCECLFKSVVPRPAQRTEDERPANDSSGV